MSNPFASRDVDAMYTAIRTDFSHSIDEYKKECKNFWYGWALEMEQKVMVSGGTTHSDTTADIDDSTVSTDVFTCPYNGKLTIVHCFESEVYVPIPNTPFKIQAVKFGFDETIYQGTTDKNGQADVQLDAAKYRGKQLDIIFSPDITKSDIQILLRSYDDTLEKLGNWLDDKWVSQKQEWDAFVKEEFTLTEALEDFYDGLVSSIVRAWDEISNLFQLLSHPQKLAEQLAKFFSDPDAIADMLANAKEDAAKMLSMLKDEARLFLLVKAVYCRVRMLTPAQIVNALAKGLADVLVEVVISFVIPGGAALKSVNAVRNVAGATAGIKA